MCPSTRTHTDGRTAHAAKLFSPPQHLHPARQSKNPQPEVGSLGAAASRGKGRSGSGVPCGVGPFCLPAGPGRAFVSDSLPAGGANGSRAAPRHSPSGCVDFRLFESIPSPLPPPSLSLSFYFPAPRARIKATDDSPFAPYRRLNALCRGTPHSQHGPEPAGLCGAPPGRARVPQPHGHGAQVAGSGGAGLSRGRSAPLRSGTSPRGTPRASLARLSSAR